MEISSLVKETCTLGSIRYGTIEAEHKSKAFRHSFCKDIAEDKQLTVSIIRTVHPGFMLTLKYLKQVLGKRVKHEPISWYLF